MTKPTLTVGDLEVILTSLEYSKQRIEDYAHETYEIKRQSLVPIEAAIAKVRAMRRARKKVPSGQVTRTRMKSG